MKSTRASARRRKFPSLEAVTLYVILTVLAILFVLPVFYLFMGAFKAESELFRVPFKWLPDKFILDNFSNMFQSIPFMRYLKNTMIIVVFNIVGSLLSCSLVAYGFSRLRWPGRDKVFILVLITMILPYQVTLVPLFLMFTKIKWIGTFLPLIVPCFFGNPFFIFLLRQFFTGIPQDISEAARIDGASEFTIFSRLILPMAKPALTTVALFAFIRSWNDFLGPLVFLGRDELYTLSLAASMLKSNLDPNWSVLLALGTVMILPVLLIFFVMQKYFIQGIAMSGIKG
ncbi:MAG: carbohydrate ABC transporter permease [Lachnospiraceae bacterium]|jgi:ABC-type sugar transport system, permease component|nr:carbohydrate ABC transporter permease [Lachnospiraceae bacterium]